MTGPSQPGADRSPHWIAPDFSDATVVDLIDLSGRVAVVTGAANGIGRATARRLREAGATTWSLDLAYPSVREDTDADRRLTVDVTDPTQVSAAIEHIVDHDGSLDIWVHAAGILPRANLLEISLADWQNVIRTNIDGTFICAQQAGRTMAEHGGGVIITLASTVAYRVNSNAAHYRATKAAVLALTQNLAIELAPYGIRALAVCPTLTLTEAVKQLQRENPDGGIDRYGARLPLGRAAVPDDIARVVLFAASALASYMTGSALLVDGGELQR